MHCRVCDSEVGPAEGHLPMHTGEQTLVRWRCTRCPFLADLAAFAVHCARTGHPAIGARSEVDTATVAMLLDCLDNLQGPPRLLAATSQTETTESEIRPGTSTHQDKQSSSRRSLTNHRQQANWPESSNLTCTDMFPAPEIANHKQDHQDKNRSNLSEIDSHDMSAVSASSLTESFEAPLPKKARHALDSVTDYNDLSSLTDNHDMSAVSATETSFLQDNTPDNWASELTDAPPIHDFGNRELDRSFAFSHSKASQDTAEKSFVHGANVSEDVDQTDSIGSSEYNTGDVHHSQSPFKDYTSGNVSEDLDQADSIGSSQDNTKEGYPVGSNDYTSNVSVDLDQADSLESQDTGDMSPSKDYRSHPWIATPRPRKPRIKRHPVWVRNGGCMEEDAEEKGKVHCTLISDGGRPCGWVAEGTSAMASSLNHHIMSRHFDDPADFYSKYVKAFHVYKEEVMVRQSKPRRKDPNRKRQSQPKTHPAWVENGGCMKEDKAEGKTTCILVGSAGVLCGWVSHTSKPKYTAQSNYLHKHILTCHMTDPPDFYANYVRAFQKFRGDMARRMKHAPGLKFTSRTGGYPNKEDSPMKEKAEPPRSPSPDSDEDWGDEEPVVTTYHRPKRGAGRPKSHPAWVQNGGCVEEDPRVKGRSRCTLVNDAGVRCGWESKGAVSTLLHEHITSKHINDAPEFYHKYMLALRRHK